MSRLVRLQIARRKGCRRPEGSRFLVANEHDLARLIADRIVAPRRQAILVTVDGPRVSAASLRAGKSKLRLGDDIRPGRRSQRAPGAVGENHILTSVVGKPAGAIRHVELGLLTRSDRGLRRRLTKLVDRTSPCLVEQLLRA